MDAPVFGLTEQELAAARVCLQCRVITVERAGRWVHTELLREKFAFTGICDNPQPGAPAKEREIRFGRGKAPGDRHSISGALEVGYVHGDPVVVGTDGGYKAQQVKGRMRKMISWGFVASTGAYGAGVSAPSTAVVGRERVLVGELRAVYWALKAVPDVAPVLVLVDSAYAIQWLQRWQSGDRGMPNGYSLDRVDGRTAGLVELAEILRERADLVRMEWVRAHQGVPLNEGADELARRCRVWSKNQITKQVLREQVAMLAERALIRHFAAEGGSLDWVASATRVG